MQEALRDTVVTVCKHDVEWQFAPAIDKMLAHNYPALDTMETEHMLELQRETEGNTLHQVAKLLDILEMWQGSQNLHAT